MKAYQNEDRINARTELGLNSDAMWQKVLQEIREVEQDATVHATQGFLGAVRKCSRRFGESGDAFTLWLKMLPDDAYGSIICGGLTLIISAAVRHRDLCIEVFDALGVIPEIIRTAECSFGQYKSEHLDKAIASLYKIISESLRGILEFYHERAPGRFRGVARNVLKAIAKGPEYGKQIKLDIANVQQAVRRVKREAEICFQERVGDMRSNQEFQTKLLQTLYVCLRYQHQCSMRAMEENERRRRQEYAAINQDYATVHQELTSISQLANPAMSLKQELSMQQFLEILFTSPTIALHDLRYIKQQGELFSTTLQAQVSAFVECRQLQDWLTTTNGCRCLFAQTDSGGHSPVSALSFVSSLLFQTLQTLGGASFLHYTCGLHTDKTDNRFAGAEGMLQSLIAQLIASPQRPCFSLAFVDRSLYERIRAADLLTLCTVFETLLRQLPVGAIVFLIIDGVSFYETDDKIKGMCCAMSKLIQMCGSVECTVKLLATSPGISGTVRKGFREEDIVLVPEAGFGDGDGQLTGRTHFNLVEPFQILTQSSSVQNIISTIIRQQCTSRDLRSLYTIDRQRNPGVSPVCVDRSTAFSPQDTILSLLLDQSSMCPDSRPSNSTLFITPYR